MNMKKIFILSAVLALFSACNANKDEWKLVWSDEFDGEQIDEATWTRVPTGKDDWDDMMSLREDLAYVENGELVLADELTPDTCRLLDEATGECMDKDRFRRDLGRVRETYEEVANRLRNVLNK